MNTHNINLAMCLKEQRNLGETIVHNVCTGQVYSVPWGNIEWFSASFFSFCLVGFIASVSYLAWSLREKQCTH